MKRLTAILVPLVAFASPAVAANTPEVLVQELTQAAHNGDESGFLSNMSVENDACPYFHVNSFPSFHEANQCCVVAEAGT